MEHGTPLNGCLPESSGPRRVLFLGTPILKEFAVDPSSDAAINHGAVLIAHFLP